MLEWTYERCVEIAKAMKRPIITRIRFEKYASSLPEHAQRRRRRDGLGSFNERREQVPAVVGRANLFVVGGSAFPQNAAQGRPNDRMLACWAADGIKETL